MASYRDLVVWEKSMELVEEIYRLVKCLPKEEMYALSDQMRRSAISIPSNIAEGHGRHSKKDFSRFLLIAQGSRAELESQLEICARLNYLSREQLKDAFDLCSAIGKMLRSLYRSLDSEE